MYLFINSIKNIGRNKGRNILIGIIMLALITVSIISLSINNTTGSIIDDFKTRFSSEVKIAPDFSNLRRVSDFKFVTPRQYLDFADSEYLAEAIFTGTTVVSSEDIKAVDEDELDNLLGGIGGGGVMSSGTIPTMNLIGNQWEDFTNGYRSLMDGSSMPKNSGECIISKELADLNNLKVGDELTLNSSSSSFINNEMKTTSNTIKVKITGIYLDATEAYSASASMKLPSLNRRNDILTPIETLIENGSDSVVITAKYYLKNPSMLKDFEAELRAKGLAEYYLVNTDESGYQKVVGPVEGLKKVSLTFMIIVLAFGAVIIVLLSTIAIRERKYEIGVLRAMGMKKRKVIFGLWIEMLMITACCLIIGIGMGSALAQPVSDTLLAGQIENAKAAATQNNNGIYSGIYSDGNRQETIGGPQEPVPLEQVDISVGIDTIIEIAVIALLLASIASMAAIVKVTKYEPIKILMERN